jgi:hypothetical protein
MLTWRETMFKHRLAVALVLATAVCIACAASAGAAKGHGHKDHAHKTQARKAHNQAAATAYEFRGDLVSASSSAVQLTVEGGNHDALKALLGQSQGQTFTLDAHTRIEFEHGRHTSVAELRAGDDVLVRIRAPKGASLSEIESHPAQLVVDRQRTARMAGPLFLYVGTVSGAQPADHVSLHVTSGNWRALHTMLGQSLDQSFATGSATIYLLWQSGHATVISPSELKPGDRITVRVHARADATLAQVEATIAAHVGDHEPGNPESEA